MDLFRDRTNFGKPVWVCIAGPYLYVHESLAKLLYMMVTEWREDQHLVG